MQINEKTVSESSEGLLAGANQAKEAEAAEASEKNKARAKPGKVRRVIGDMLIGWTAAFAVYLSAGMLYRIHTVSNPDTYWEVLRDEWCILGVLLALTVDLRTGFLTGLRAIPFRLAGWTARIASCAVIAVVLALAGSAVCRGMVSTASCGDSVIVLGMALENGEPNKDLLYRLKTAEDYAARHPPVTISVTGGKQTDQALSEAEVMKRLLVSDGVDESRIVTEDQAETTRENFEYVARIIDPTSPVVIVTSDYHMGRAVNIAHRAGFTAVEKLSAPSDPLFYGVNVMWEVIGELDTAVHWKSHNAKSSGE